MAQVRSKEIETAITPTVVQVHFRAIATAAIPIMEHDHSKAVATAVPQALPATTAGHALATAVLVAVAEDNKNFPE